jgi:hypothetical protein
MKQLVRFLSKYLSPAQLFSTDVMEQEIDTETEMAGIWQGYIHVDGKDIKPIWFLLKDSGSFEVFVSPFDKDPFRLTGIWEISDNYFSAAFNGRTDKWILEGVMNEERNSIKGDIIIQGDLIEIIDSETTNGVFILKK